MYFEKAKKLKHFENVCKFLRLKKYFPKELLKHILVFFFKLDTKRYFQVI